MIKIKIILFLNTIKLNKNNHNNKKNNHLIKYGQILIFFLNKQLNYFNIISMKKQIRIAIVFMINKIKYQNPDYLIKDNIVILLHKQQNLELIHKIQMTHKTVIYYH